jgi:chromatin modification-related protein EAF6
MYRLVALFHFIGDPAEELTQNTQAVHEEDLFRQETAYLEETPAGNIVKGFDNYIKGSVATGTVTGAGTSTRRKGGISDADRIFSRTSANFQRVCYCH